MGDRLRADLTRIADTGSQLSDIKAQFDNAGQLADDLHDIIGRNELADRLNDFANNWKLNRDKLSTSLGSLSALCTQAAQAYGSTDEQLAQSLLDAMSGQANP